MYYAVYKSVRDAAWKCLSDFNITALPVDVLNIARSAGVVVIKNSNVQELMPNEFARSYFDGKTWVIVYDETMPREQCRYVIAHELGHYFLGHDEAHKKYDPKPDPNKKPVAESNADIFATKLLCPACVLWKLDLHTAEEIAEVCSVPIKIARKRSTRMKALYKRQKFLSAPEERKVFENFKPFFDKKIEERRREKNTQISG